MAFLLVLPLQKTGLPPGLPRRYAPKNDEDGLDYGFIRDHEQAHKKTFRLPS
jgi:hypothetical protein